MRIIFSPEARLEFEEAGRSPSKPMTTFLPKFYQQSVLDSVETYFRACLQWNDANTAFYQTTQSLWNKGVTYFCLRVPTGGGNGWTDAADDRMIGSLWAALSGGRCHFVMIKNKEWDVIDAEISRVSA